MFFALNNQILRRVWQFVRVPLAVIFVLFVGLVIYRIPVVKERARTEEVVKKIQSQKLTMADVTGERLPPEPDPLLKDATVEGIDFNENGIRDDVELAIFKLHPNSARIRAAELQYAMALQNELTSDVFNSDTLVAIIKQEGRGYLCISENKNITEVESLVFNNESRKKVREDIRKKYLVSFSLSSESECDIPNL